MKVNDIKPEDMKSGQVFYYVDDKNSEIKSAKHSLIKENTGYFLIPGKIKIADGSVYIALLGISSDNGGEMFEAHILLDGKWISQESKDFLKKLGKKKEQIFPFKYHLNTKVEVDEHKSHQF